MIRVESVYFTFADYMCIWPLGRIFKFTSGAWGGNGIFESGYDTRRFNIYGPFFRIEIQLSRKNGKEPDDLDTV